MAATNTIRATANQTIYDVAVKYYGTTDAVGELLALNPDLRNDPAALAALGIDYLADDSFFPDVALAPGLTVTIATGSSLLRQEVARQLRSREINTFNI